ncbi:AMP-binding protein [Jannaschia sp. W003]|uniref:AMP-binding protein n=1 Tax=Jannaschia sp. W003 TaxID=2867012 RepID=UPI0021A8C94F|nr:AMP-binding protein [Jannaschia sp. W003]UWQ21971.1 AMP-binding protein [Jannaschia sp. W003]
MTVFRSHLPDVALRDTTIPERVFEGLRGREDEAVLIDGPTGRALTGAGLMDAVKRLAGGLAADGVGPGRVVALLAPNCPEYAVAMFGALWAGGTVTTLNPSYTASEVRHQLEDSGAEWLVVPEAMLETARAGIEGTKVRRVVVMDGTGADGMEAAMGAAMEAPAAVDLDAPALLPYSSGTTGLPKGVMLSHRQAVANIDQILGFEAVEPGETGVFFLPFFHIYGMQAGLTSYLAAGARIVTLPRFDPQLYLELCQRHRSRTLWVVPPVALMLAKHPVVESFDLSAVEMAFSAAAPLGGELGEAMGRRLGCVAGQGYGMTEAAPVVTLMNSRTARPGSVGVLAPMTEARIVDPETGRDMGQGEEDELWVRGPQVMTGYLNRPEATAETLVEGGWLRTGDIARFDADGYLFIADRLKELIKVKGFQVAPAELEAELCTHPEIADAAVIGEPDDEAGEVPVAFVVRAEGSEISEEAVKAHLAGRLATYKQLRRVSFVDAIPKSASGKILRRMLRAAG